MKCEICRKNKKSVKWRDSIEGERELCFRCGFTEYIQAMTLIPLLVMIAFIYLIIGVFSK